MPKMEVPDGRIPEFRCGTLVAVEEGDEDDEPTAFAAVAATSAPF